MQQHFVQILLHVLLHRIRIGTTFVFIIMTFPVEIKLWGRKTQPKNSSGKWLGYWAAIKCFNQSPLHKIVLGHCVLVVWGLWYWFSAACLFSLCLFFFSFFFSPLHQTLWGFSLLILGEDTPLDWMGEVLCFTVFPVGAEYMKNPSSWQVSNAELMIADQARKAQELEPCLSFRKSSLEQILLGQVHNVTFSTCAT